MYVGGYIIAEGLETSSLWGGQCLERCHALLFDNNVVGEMMHHETLFFALGGIAL